jgi:hypothetical protein
VKIFGRFLFPWISCFCHLLSCSVCAQISQEPNLSSIEPLKRLRFFSLLASRASLASYSVLRPTAASLGNLFLLAHFSARKFLATVPLLVVGSCLGFCFSRGSGFVSASACVSSRSQARVPLRAARISAHFPLSLCRSFLWPVSILALLIVLARGLDFLTAWRTLRAIRDFWHQFDLQSLPVGRCHSACVLLV